MNDSKDYYQERNIRTTKRIRELLCELPEFVKEFFIGIQMRTTALTRLNYAYDLRIFFDYLSKMIYDGKKDCRAITIADIEKLQAIVIESFMEYLSDYSFQGKNYRCNERAKERKLSTLRSFFNYYYKKDKLSCNICAKVDLPKLHDKPIIRLEGAEVPSLLAEAANGYGLSKTQQKFHARTQKRDIAILTLFLGTGIRISELVGLNKTDFDFDSKSFLVTRKGGSKSILYFSDEVAKVLREYLDWLQCEIDEATDFGNKIKKEPTPLFYSMQGKRISVRAVEMLVEKYSRIATPLKHITPHKLRSTYGTALYRATEDIYVVAEVLGHKDINTTKKHYAAMSEEIRKKAASAVRYENTGNVGTTEEENSDDTES